MIESISIFFIWAMFSILCYMVYMMGYDGLGDEYKSELACAGLLTWVGCSITAATALYYSI